jgi:Zn-dependent peptidase ImmA (M78 family)
VAAFIDVDERSRWVYSYLSEQNLKLAEKQMRDLRREGIKYLMGGEISPTNLPKKQVEDFTTQVATALHFDVGGDLRGLIEQLEGRLHYQSLFELVEESGSIFVHGECDFDILLPQYTSPTRDRFTLAHELGHYFLHSNQGETQIIATRLGSTRIEWEANWFAAQLLMPREPFIKRFKKTTDLAAIASIFKVSVDAAEVRRKSLGL